MKKYYLTSIILVGLVPFLNSCASTQDVETLTYHVRSINKKLDDMKVNTVEQMQQRQASSSGQLDQLQVDILQLKAKLEENAHMNRMLQEQNKEFQLALQSLQKDQKEQLNKQLSVMQTKITIQEESLAAIQKARIADAERRSKAAAQAADAALRKAKQAQLAAARPAPVQGAGTIHLRPSTSKRKFTASGTTVSTPALVRPAPRAATPVAAVPAPASTDTYGEAQQNYRDGNYRKAFKLFEKYAGTKNSGKDSITARYMMGECLFKEGEYDQAIIQYQQIISNFPGNPQAATALLRQGEAFEQLSDNETAKIIYKKLVASYGSSPEAVTAKKRISSL